MSVLESGSYIKVDLLPFACESKSTEHGRLLTRYINSYNLRPTPEIHCAEPSTLFSVIIPAYNEQRGIADTLHSVDRASGGRAEIIVGNNNSSDDTRAIVIGLQGRLNSPLTVIDCEPPGCGPTRRRVIDEVIVQHARNDPSGERPRYLVLLDADSTVPPDGLTRMYEAFRKSKADIVTNIYKYPSWVDQAIYESIGIENFFGRRADVAQFLAQNDCAQLRTNGVNSAIEIASFAKIGGISSGLSENGLVNHSDTQLGVKIRRNGGVVAQHSSVAYTSPRRVLESMGRNEIYRQNSDLAVPLGEEVDDGDLLEAALKGLSREEWMLHRAQGEFYIVDVYVVLPILLGQLDFDPLKKLVGSDHPLIKTLDKAICDIQSRNPQEKYSLRDIQRKAITITEEHGQPFIEAVTTML